MMRWLAVVSFMIVGAICGRVPIHAQGEDAHLPVSIERIRAALQQPPPILRLPTASNDVPTFRVDIQERVPLLDLPDETPFDLTYGLPSIGELMMDGIARIRSAVVTYKRGRAERRARKEVEDALAAFCEARGCPTSATAR